MAQLSQITAHVRTYTVSDGLDRVPEIARRYGMTVSLGIWIGPDLEANKAEIEKAIKVALANRRVIDRVFVGNEAILSGDVTPEQLNGYIREVRAALPNRIKVSTAEPWSTWLLNPDLGKYVDFVTVHLLPYWEGIDVRGALTFDQHAIGHIRDEFPGQADRHRRDRLALRRPHAHQCGSLARQSGLLRAQLRSACAGEGLRLLPHGGL